MSKPNLLGFASSVGIYRNKRVRDLHDFLGKSVRRKVDFADLAPMLFQVVMAYAGENQINGDFSTYNSKDWSEIFQTNHVQVSPAEASAIVKGFEEVGLLDGGKIRSWIKFNRHLADYDGIVKARRLAGKLSAKKRELEAKAALKTGKISAPEGDGNHLKNGSKNGVESDSPSKQLWLLEKALESAKGPARKELLAKKRALLEGSTGVDLSNPPPSPALPAPERKRSPHEFKIALLNAARQLVEDDSAELLTEGMVKALLEAGHEVPQRARSKFPKLIAELGDRNNPVPG